MFLSDFDATGANDKGSRKDRSRSDPLDRRARMILDRRGD